MWSKQFWIDAVERAVKTFAQVAVATVVASNVIGLVDLDYGNIASVAGLAAVLSVLTSVGSAPFSNKGTASLTTEVNYQPNG